MKKFLLGWAMVFTIVACSDKTDITPAPEIEPPVISEISSFNVTTEGFKSEDQNLDGIFKTEIRKGDIIGLYIVNAEGELDDCLRMTFNGEGWTIAGNSEGKIEFDSRNRYFAIFPYDRDNDSNVDPSANEADGFFAKALSGWSPATDQSDIEKGFRSSMVMTARCGISADGNAMDINLKPATSLVCFTPGSTTYKFDNTPAIPDYVVPAAVTFEKIVPAKNGWKYFYQINPASSVTVTGTADGTGWEQEISGAEAGKVLNIVLGDEITESYTLQTGDFFLADGKLISKDAPESEVRAAHVIGIVTNIDPDRICQRAKDDLGGTVHGTVASTLENDGYGWYGTYDEYTRDESEIGLAPVASTELSAKQVAEALDSDIDGYLYTRTIFEKRTDDVEAGLYPLFSSTLIFPQISGGPAENTLTTGWYVPSSGELLDFFRTACDLPLTPDDETFNGVGNDINIWWESTGTGIAGAINQSMVKVNEACKTILDEAQDWSTFYWTSSPSADNLAIVMYFIGIYPGEDLPNEDINCNSSLKCDETRLSRLMLVF